MSDIDFVEFFKDIGVALIGACIVILVGLFYKGIDRILAARMQARIGPPVWQPFYDKFKLLQKETVVPKHAVPSVFNTIPAVGLVAVLAAAAFIPFGSFDAAMDGYGDLILVIYLLAIPALAMVIGGYASNSPYATVGAQREMVLMMSYEIPLATAIVTVAWQVNNTMNGAGGFALADVVANPVWDNVGPAGYGGFILLLAAMLIVIPGKLPKLPFDQAEAETELCGGLLVEYSGRNLAMYYLTDAVKTVVLSGLVVALFFPYGITHWFDIGGAAGAILDLLFFFVKIFIVMFFSVTVTRVSFARLQISDASWIYLVPVSILAVAGSIFVYLDGVVL